MQVKPAERSQGRAKRKRSRSSADPYETARRSCILLRQLHNVGLSGRALGVLFRCSERNIFHLLASIPPEARAMIDRGELAVIPQAELAEIFR